MRGIKNIAAALLVCSGVAAAGQWAPEGQNGVIMVHGELTENACRLEMASEWQEVDLGVVEVRRLQYLGAHGTPVDMQLHLRDCMRAGGQSTNAQSQTVVWSSFQPAVSVTLSAQTDAEAPELVRVTGGAEGFGLRIRDERGRTVVPGVRQDAHLLMPSQDALTYTIVPERTTAPLKAGAFSSRLDVRLSYD